MAKRRLISSFAGKEIATCFKLIKKTCEIKRILTHACVDNSRITIRPRGVTEDHVRFESALLDGGLSEERLQVVRPRGAKMPGNIKECLMLVYLKGQAIVGAAIEFKGEDQQHFTFTLPTCVFKLQRRGAARYSIPNAYEIYVRFKNNQNKPLKKRLIDVSQRGLSFMVESKQEAAVYKRGMFIRRLEFRIMGREIVTDVEVRNIIGSTAKAIGSARIGVDFARISKTDADYIESYVLGHIFNSVV
ncbi:MAG: PilZ domain-containing protein [Bdellovibrionota bacterium]